MRFFNRKVEEEEVIENSRTRKMTTDDGEVKKRKKKDKYKPWGKYERLLVVFVFGGTALVSALLAMSARAWRLPGTPKLSIPKINVFQETYEFKGDTKNPEQFVNIEKQIEDKVAGLSGVYGVYVERIGSGESYGIMERETFQAASLIKLPVMAAVYMEAEKDNLNLNSDVPGSNYTYKELVKRMGQQSDNEAFKAVRAALGDDKINLVIDKIGMSKTSLVENETTPVDIAKFFKKLYEGDIVIDRRAKELLDYLTDTIYEEWIPAGITDVTVAHKYGREVHVVNDAGIVFTDNPFILVIVSKGAVETEADKIIPEIAKLVYEFEIKDTKQ